MLDAREKLYFLIGRIIEKRYITPKGKPIQIDLLRDISRSYNQDDLEIIFEKLEADEKVLRVTGRPDYPIDPIYGGSTCYLFELTDSFDEYYAKIQLEPEYQEFTGKKPVKPPQPQREKSIMVSDVVYKITYTDSREVLINDLFQLAKPNFDNENDLVFQFLYDNPNKKWGLKEIQEKVGNITKTLHKIVENLGFTGEFKKVFFEVSETAVCFKNPITKGDLEKLGIKQIKLPR